MTTSHATTSHAGAILTIDLDAIAANWRSHVERLAPGAECAAVVKANAYGLGLDRVAPALAKAGCRRFFVALLDEALKLRALLPEAKIHVLNGLEAGSEGEFLENRLTPILDSLDEISLWSTFARVRGQALEADLHVDTAMARLGLPPEEMATLAAEPERLEGIAVSHLMSHLACAEDRDNPLNQAQLEDFWRHREALEATVGPFKASLANSSGIFLGPEYHFDLVRPGASLYGVNPTPEEPNPMAQVVRLQGKILQVRQIDSGRSVGYGATWTAERISRIATVAVGYGDGYPRTLGNVGVAAVGETKVPVVGRVSMDLITLDVTDVPDGLARPGAYADLIGPLNPVDDLAQAAGTIGYEILTNLGPRYERVYTGTGA